MISNGFENFMEHKTQSSHHTISKIEYETGPCFGTCPVFSLVLVENGDSNFMANAYNFETPVPDWDLYGEGEFKAQINQADWDELVLLLHEIDFTNLSDNYDNGMDDDQNCTLTVYYDDGKVKKIDDAGLAGSDGLKILYQKLFAIRKNQDWVEFKRQR